MMLTRSLALILLLPLGFRPDMAEQLNIFPSALAGDNRPVAASEQPSSAGKPRRKYKKANYTEEQKEKRRQFCRLYEKRNRVKRNEYKRKYRHANLEACKAYARNYQKTHPEMFRLKALRRRARKQTTEIRPDLIAKFYLRIKDKPTFKCFYCKKRFPSSSAEIDHVVSLHDGGLHEVGNLAAACAFCNGSKWKWALKDWKRKGQLFLI